MSALTNIAHEKFIQRVFAGEAARKAYMEEVATRSIKLAIADAAASRLLHSPKIKLRLQELHEMGAKRIIRTKAGLVERVWKIMDKAEKAGQYAVAKSCAELLGREVGAFTEHKKITVRRLADMDEVELREMLNDEQLVAGNESAGSSGYTH